MMHRRKASRLAALIVAVPAFALSSCAAAGPPISVDRGDGGAVLVAAVDRDDFGEALGAVSPIDQAAGGESAGDDGAATQGPSYHYLIDPPLSGDTPQRALLVSTSVLPAGSYLQLLDGDGREVDLLRLAAVPAAVDTGRREHVLHLDDPTAIHGIIVRPPPGWEPPETAESGAPVASLAAATRFFGAVHTGDALRLGAATRLSVSLGSSLEWSVELPADRIASGASGDGAVGGAPGGAGDGGEQTAAAGTGPARGRLEIDYVTDTDAVTDAAATEEARRAIIDLAGPAVGGAGAGGELSVSYRVRLSRGSGTIALPAPALGFVPAVVTVRSSGAGVAVRRVQWHETTARSPGAPAAPAGRSDGSAEATPAGRSGAAGAAREPDINSPIPADLSTILSSYPRSAWRRNELELFSWSAYPDILVFDTADYETQARLFKRLAFFVEKRGFRGRMLSDAELAGRHGWNAHNYRPEGLSSFFTQAEAQAVELNAEEDLLRELLLANGVIRRSADDGYAPGKGGVLAISQSSYPLLRELLITHEAFHGVFYEDEAFRDGVREIWNGLSQAERSYWRDLLSYMTYDPADEYLMINEFQAYLMQQPLERVRGYLRGVLAPRFARARPAQRGRIERFLSEHPDTFIRAARAVEQLLSRSSPLSPGDVLLLRPADGEA